nr:ribosome-associated translation inhibitor RaiA [Bdellovibrio sp. HM001]
MMDLKIQFVGFPESVAVTSAIQDHADTLEETCPQLLSCHVVVERPPRKQHQGGIYHIKIRMTVPGNILVVDRERGLNHAHEDVYVAIRDAFLSARRRVDEYMRMMGGYVKTKNNSNHAKVLRISPDLEYGFLLTEDNREIYFHRNSVVTGNFDELMPGQEVRFAEDMGEKGPKATSVHVLGANGHRGTFKPLEDTSEART